MNVPPRIRACQLAVLLILGGCALQEYKPDPLKPAISAASYEARSGTEIGLRDYLRTHGVDTAAWPVTRWSLKELTVLAFYFHPDLALARAQVKAARASLEKVAGGAGLEVGARLERHQDTRPEDSGPWSLGFEVSLPLLGVSRRSALIEAEQLALESTELEVGEVAWGIRSRVRAALLARQDARRGLESAEREIVQYEALVKLLQRRLQEGMTSAGEVTSVRLRATQARGDAEGYKLAAERAIGDLSAALGLPPEIARALPLADELLETLPPAPDARMARSQALLNRVDIRSRLLAYAGAESAVKLEVARQFPEFRLSPGFLWDQGHGVWSLGLGLMLPPGLGNHRGIQLALAQRDVAARQFEQLQIAVLSESAARAAIYRQSLEGLKVMEAQTALVQQRLNETEKLFAGGYADRVALVQGRLEAVVATRAAWTARRAALEALGQLEEAMQLPIAGAPLPRFSPGDGRP